MRRSANVVAPLLATAALALLTACKSTETERCVDEHNAVVDPKFCANLPPGAQQPVAGSPNNGGGYYSNGIFFPHFYRPYYGGYGGIGGFAGGGSFAPSAGIATLSPEPPAAASAVPSAKASADTAAANNAATHHHPTPQLAEHRRATRPHLPHTGRPRTRLTPLLGRIRLLRTHRRRSRHPRSRRQ
jgi:hypothetical protein